MNTIDADLASKIDLWFKYDKNPETLEQIQSLFDKKDVKKLKELLGKRIKFGTAGLRSDMQAGWSKMNSLTVLQASQGLAEYYLANPLDTKNQEQPTIVVGHDHRFHSQEFAEFTCKAFLLKGFKVYYLNYGKDVFVHTPLVPFAINYFKANTGVMVTASHNPGKDNGYKVYHSNGCQIIPPVDSGISDKILENLLPIEHIWEPLENVVKIVGEDNLVDVNKEITMEYLYQLKQKLNFNELTTKNQNETNKKPWFVYTPMHGVGKSIFTLVMADFGLFGNEDYLIPSKQALPDPSFPTVFFPNPEEKGALKLSIETAEKFGRIKLIVATDPDADRFSLAYYSDAAEKYIQLTGDEIGHLFAYYMLKKGPANGGMITSTVSSGLLKRLCSIEKRPFKEVLTGFKWIGNAAMSSKEPIVFGYEEAIGYMFPSLLYDKDGISAATVFLQLYQFFDQDLDGVLKTIYEKYGHFKQNNSYYVGNPEQQAHVFEITREWLSTSYKGPESKFGDFEMICYRDLTKNIQYDPSGKLIECDLPTGGGDMITYWFKLGDSNEIKVTTRGSGTEPKLKVYIECMSLIDGATAESVAAKMWDTLAELFIKPTTTGVYTRDL
ncbi:Phosphoglucomutase, first 3 domain-containing protein [Hanseniaspora valbyensis NRRL Y-1626]|uniref:Phosphoglucomutase, first 3 domain-containing protein n=1 Tax=Hanseniaspora valbyensis NRRL Y-1626 TaxID=766949 RepID=A0A1B7T914_9ASCO|nr:Phosphoglucomutase, first 3 domain-containing protein [Hanseniaspora valbyensis NRRL Y-1626]